MLELYQAEWCPFSHMVRERLTELGVTYVIHQVEPVREQRDELERISGTREIPVLATESGEFLHETDRILAYLDEAFTEPPEAEGHRAQVRAHRR